MSNSIILRNPGFRRFPFFTHRLSLSTWTTFGLDLGENKFLYTRPFIFFTILYGPAKVVAIVGLIITSFLDGKITEHHIPYNCQPLVCLKSVIFIAVLF